MRAHKARAAVIAAMAILAAGIATFATPTPAVTMATCSEEDGSAPGQLFPCAWTGGANGIGASYILVVSAN